MADRSYRTKKSALEHWDKMIHEIAICDPSRTDGMYWLDKSVLLDAEQPFSRIHTAYLNHLFTHSDHDIREVTLVWKPLGTQRRYETTFLIQHDLDVDMQFGATEIRHLEQARKDSMFPGIMTSFYMKPDSEQLLRQKARAAEKAAEREKEKKEKRDGERRRQEEDMEKARIAKAKALLESQNTRS